MQSKGHNPKRENVLRYMCTDHIATFMVSGMMAAQATPVPAIHAQGGAVGGL